MKRYPKSESIQNAEIKDETAYITWGDDADSRQKALNESSKALSEFDVISRTSANSRYRTDFSNLDTGVSGRPGLTRSDYNVFRPDEAVPEKFKNIIKSADSIYHKVGLVKNVIDLMGDFACQGIRISHPNKRIQRFYRNWFDKVNGYDRSERFLNNLYRTGNVVINRQTAKISLKVTDKMYKASASADMIVSSDEPNVEKREIPWKYTFIDPSYVDIVGSALASFSGNKIYAITIPSQLRRIINNPKNDYEKKIVGDLPQSIKDAAKSKKPYVLDKEKTLVFHYKKDDWSTWAYPMIYSIMDDIFLIEKLKLADLAALDGAISNVRIFKLGSLDHKIAPTQAATARLASILQNNVGGGTMDLVWGPDIELLESKTAVHQFLGEGKYTPHLNSVYAGLGIPPTLTGTYGAAGTTNNFISLKTLTQRLQYGRKILTSFWKHELSLVQKAMGFRLPAKVEFDRMDLSNEDAEKALLIQLADRNIISDEALQTAFGIDTDLEKSRVKKEAKERDRDSYVKKSGPYHNAEFDNDLKKISLQTGIVTPSQIGLELENKKKGEKSLLDIKNDAINSKRSDTNFSPNGVSGQGRPKNSKDSQQRKTKEFRPQTGAKLTIWASQAIEKINDIINPKFLEFYSKKNMRSLSSEEYLESENMKTKILFALEPLQEITENSISHVIFNLNDKTNQELYKLYHENVKSVSSLQEKEITLNNLNLIKIQSIKDFYS
jgi:hypothetical protein